MRYYKYILHLVVLILSLNSNANHFFISKDFSYHDKTSILESNIYFKESKLELLHKIQQKKDIQLIKKFNHQLKNNSTLNENLFYKKLNDELISKAEKEQNEYLEKKIKEGIKVLNEQIELNEKYLKEGNLSSINYIIDMRYEKNKHKFISEAKLKELNVNLTEFYSKYKIPFYIFINSYYVDKNLGVCLHMPFKTHEQVNDYNKKYIQALTERSKLTNEYGEGVLFDIENILSVICSDYQYTFPTDNENGANREYGFIPQIVEFKVNYKHYIAFGNKLSNNTINALVKETNINDLRRDDNQRELTDQMKFSGGGMGTQRRDWVLENYITAIQKVIVKKYNKGEFTYATTSSTYRTELKHLSDDDKVAIKNIINNNQYNSPNKIEGNLKDYANLNEYLEKFNVSKQMFLSKQNFEWVLITSSASTTFNGKNARQLAKEETQQENTVIVGMDFQIENNEIVVYWNFNFPLNLSQHFNAINCQVLSKYINSLDYKETALKYLGFWVNNQIESWNTLFSFIDKVAIELTNLLKFIKIPAKYYDPDNIDYNPLVADYIKYLHYTTIPFETLLLNSVLKTIVPNEKYNPNRLTFAYLCGFFNGIIGQLEGITETISMLTSRSKIAEAYNGFKYLIENGIFWSTIGKKIAESHKGNPCIISHQIGKDIAEVATFAIAFAKTGKLATVAKVFDTIDPFTHIFKGVFYLFEPIAIQGINAIKAFAGSVRFAYTFAKVNGKTIIKVAKEISQVWREIDWSLVKTVQLKDPLSGRYYNVMLAMDPTDKVNDALYKMKGIIKDNYGNTLDASGTVIAKVEREGVEELLPAKLIREVKDYVDELKIKFPKSTQLIDKLKNQLDQLTELTPSQKGNLLEKVKALEDPNVFDDLLADLTNNATDLLPDFAKNTKLVDAWQAVKYCGDDALSNKATNLSELNNVLAHADDIASAPGYRNWKNGAVELVGKYDWGLVKRYFQHIQEVTGRAIGQKQIDKLKDALRAKEYKKLTPEEYAQHTKEYNTTRRNKMIKEWEINTGQIWPIDEKGNRYQLHHIIEQQYGGPNEWWNAHPARFPDEHQGGIHGAGSPSRELFK